ncbi:hypothetical protein CYMTET_12225, partial [Cymbomonas tetramitiformis]
VTIDDLGNLSIYDEFTSRYISTIATASQVDASQVAILNITDAATGVTMGRRTLMQTTMGVQVESIVTFLANEVQLWEDFDNALQNNPQEVFSEGNGWADKSPEVIEVDSTLKAMPPPPPSTESPTAGIAEEEVETGEGYPSPDDGDANDSSNNDGTTTIIIAVVCSVLGVFMIGGGIFAVWHLRFKQQELPQLDGDDVWSSNHIYTPGSRTSLAMDNTAVASGSGSVDMKSQFNSF